MRKHIIQHPGTRVVLVRHGQSTFNAANRFQGRSNEAELTELGRSTAARCAEKLSGIRFDAMLVSPLRRARQTAGEIALHLGSSTGDFLRAKSEPLLRELHVPHWEGLTQEEIRTQFPAEFQTWQAEPHLLQVPVAPWGRHAGKSFCPVDRLFEQARRFWNKVLQLHAGECVLAVSHAGTIRALIATALGAPCDRFPLLQQSNGAISALHFPAGLNAPAELLCLNQTSQPAENLPKTKRGRRGLRLVLSTSARQWPGVQLLRTARGRPTADLAELRQRVWKTDGQADLVTRGACIEDADLREFLAELLGLQPNAAARLLVNPEAFTILHYAQSEQLPVLQAMNVHPTN